ncbi:MAG: glycosyltransferase [Candidatus Eisenbacteria bacterium]|nr:glycosyltransferase [Candidatus Eisenbacteria bacterium]
MRVAFLADANAINTKSWVDFYAAELGHDVHVVSVNQRGTFVDGVTLHSLGSPEGTHSLSGKLAYLMRAGQIARIVRRIEPDLIIGYRVASYGYLAARTGFHPLVVAAQGQRIVVPEGSWPKRMAATKAVREADLINSWAPHMTARLVELGADPERILTCPRGIDLDLFAAREETDREIDVVTTRSLHRWYHLDVVVGAVARLAEGRAIRAVLAGEGDEREELLALAERLGVAGGVSLPGPVSYEELPGLLARSRVYVSPVPSDGVSASLLEAMATGVFPIVRDIEANRLWIENGSNGFLVAGDDVADYAEAIERALSDDGHRAKAAELNRSIVEERGDIRKNLGRIACAHEELVASYRGRGSC